MAAHDPSERNADLVRAAEAVASWARARRSTWATAPARVAPVRPAALKPEPISEPAPAAPPPRRHEPPPRTESSGVEPPRAEVPRVEPIAPSPIEPAIPSIFERFEPAPVEPAPQAVEPLEPAAAAAGPSGFTQFSERAREYAPIVVPWLPYAGVAAGIVLVAYFGLPYLLKSSPAPEPKKAGPAPAAAPAAAAPAPATPATGRNRGRIHVVSTPAGARVLVDGKARGVTPLTLADIAAGQHEVTLESSAGTVHKTVTISSNQTAEIDESIFSGWLVVYAPFEISVAEGDRSLRPDERNQILLPPGIHQLRVANKALGYEAVWSVEIKPGEISNLRVAPNPSTLTVTASDTAEVWVDGTRIGETPLNGAPMPLGTHEVLVKRLTGGERRFTITVGVKPVSLNADFR